MRQQLLYQTIFRKFFSNGNNGLCRTKRASSDCSHKLLLSSIVSKPTNDRIKYLYQWVNQIISAITIAFLFSSYAFDIQDVLRSVSIRIFSEVMSDQKWIMGFFGDTLLDSDMIRLPVIHPVNVFSIFFFISKKF